MATKRELERKYEVPADFAVAGLTRVHSVGATIGEPVEHDLTATYYDTESHRLAAKHITLRRRTGGDDAGWHLKQPADSADGKDRARTETQLPLGDPDDPVPEEITETVRPFSRGEPLRPVAIIHTRRVEHPLRGKDGTVLAVIADDQVHSEATGDPAILQYWRELEVELVDGKPALLDAVDKVLRKAGARPSKDASKLARALAEHNPETPAAPVSAGPAAALTGYLAAQRDALLAGEPGARVGDVEAVHDMRVATRRLRSTLRSFRALLDRRQTEPLREELQWVGGLLGDVRDGDVLRQRLGAAVAAEPPELVLGPVAARITERLAARTARAREALVAGLDSQRYTALLDALDRIVATPPAKVDRKTVKQQARKAIGRADGRLALAESTKPAEPRSLRRPGTPDRDERLHEARKAYKRARYAVELIEPLEGKPATKLVKRLKDLQDVLGDHQDTIVLSGLLRDYGIKAHLDGDNAFTYGLLLARAQAADRVDLGRLARARRKAARIKL